MLGTDFVTFIVDLNVLSGRHQNLRSTRQQAEGGRTRAGRARAPHQYGCDGEES